MADEIFLLINQNWLGVILGVVSLIYAIYEAKRRRGPRLCYQYKGQRLIQTDIKIIPDGLEVKFAGEVVNNLSITEIIVWNAGPQAIKDSDIPPSDRIKFRFPKDTKILRAELSRSTRDVIGAKIDYQAGTACKITYEFGFLDANDGSLITIWHDASTTMTKASGTIIGQKDGPQSYGRYRPVAPLLATAIPKQGKSFPRKLLISFSSIALNPRVMGWTMIIYGLLVVFLFATVEVPVFKDVYSAIGLLNTEFDRTISKSIFLIVMGCFLIIIGIFQLYSIKRKFPKILDPEYNNFDKGDL